MTIIFFSCVTFLLPLLDTVFCVVELTSSESVFAVNAGRAVLGIVPFVNVVKCFGKFGKSIGGSLFGGGDSNKLYLFARLCRAF
tara:strand:- start:5 stop:256 length:252 start_codon:yes stop_codon:yes gene_type:complete